MKKIYFAALAYLFLGLAFGVFFREYTKLNNFPESGETQLSVVHTHLLSLGFLFLLIVLVLEKQFGLSSHGLFNPAFWLFNVGLVTSTAMMVWHGVYQVQGLTFGSALAGLAGLGHITMSIGLLGLVVTLAPHVLSRSSEKSNSCS